MKNYSNDNIKENNSNANIKGIRLAGVKSHLFKKVCLGILVQM